MISCALLRLGIWSVAFKISYLSSFFLVFYLELADVHKLAAGC